MLEYCTNREPYRSYIKSEPVQDKSLFPLFNKDLHKPKLVKNRSTTTYLTQDPNTPFLTIGDIL